MKHILKLLLFMLILLSHKLYSQDSFSIGIKAGPQITGFTAGTELGFTDGLKGYGGIHLGLISKINISDKFKFQPEILYSLRKGKIVNNKLEISANSKRNYIDLPLNISYQLSNTFKLEAGGQIAFLLSNETENLNSNENISTYSLDANSIDFSINIGIGFDFTNNLFAQTRLNYGLTKVYNFSDYKNVLVHFSVGYWIK